MPLHVFHQTLQIMMHLWRHADPTTRETKKAREEAAGEMDDICDLCVSTEM